MKASWSAYQKVHDLIWTLKWRACKEGGFPEGHCHAWNFNERKKVEKELGFQIQQTRRYRYLVRQILAFERLLADWRYFYRAEQDRKASPPGTEEQKS